MALAPSGTPGAVGTSGATGSFILTDAMPATGASQNANAGAGVAGTSGVSGAAGAGAPSMRSTYRLDAEDSQLSPHVGHKVEITGTLDVLAGRSDSSAGATGAPNVANAPKLKVESVRMIASTCTAAQ